MIVSFVVAVSRNGVIGRDGGLPWHIPSDLKRFKAMTMGKPVVMGRKTWDGLPRRPLPGRRNIVVSRSAQAVGAGAEVADSPQRVLQMCAGDPEICIIGGGEIYRLFWPLATRLYLTEVAIDVDGDTHFPRLAPEAWRETACEVHPAAPGDSAGFVLRVLDRVPAKPQT